MTIMKSIEFFNKIPEDLINILTKLISNGYESYIVGGACRNFLLDKTIKDFDITTNALPEEVKDVLKEYTIIDTGIEYGTITVISNENYYEITTFRSEEYMNMNRKPSSVSYEKNVKNDLKRRDFTINTIIYDIKEKSFIDYFDGIHDLNNKLLRSVVTPAESYRRDPLRIMRFIRFWCELDFKPNKDDCNFIKLNSALLLNISYERIRDEFNRIMLSDNATSGLEFMLNTGILNIIIPEVSLISYFQQNNPHHYDYNSQDKTLWYHTMITVKETNGSSLEVKLSALFHDIGKPYCINVKTMDRWSFSGHAKKSAELTKQIMFRLKYSNDTIKKVTKLVLYHDYSFTQDYIVSRKLVKKVMNIFNDNINDVYDWRILKLADIKAHADVNNMKDKYLTALKDFDIIYDEIIKNKECFTLKDLAIDGNDIIDLGYSGRIIGIILQDILDKVISDKLPNDKDNIIKYLDEHKFEYSINNQ